MGGRISRRDRQIDRVNEARIRELRKKREADNNPFSFLFPQDEKDLRELTGRATNPGAWTDEDSLDQLRKDVGYKKAPDAPGMKEPPSQVNTLLKGSLELDEEDESKDKQTPWTTWAGKQRGNT